MNIELDTSNADLHHAAKNAVERFKANGWITSHDGDVLAEAYGDLLARRGLPSKRRCYPSIQLAGGDYFDFSNITDSPMAADDIASALSKIARCGGHTIGDYPFSVAQHCVIGAWAAPAHYKFEVLMHDAPEFVLGDMVTPLKQLCADYEAITKEVEYEMRRRYLLPLEMSEKAKEIDMRLAATEKRDVMPKDPPGEGWESLRGIKPYDIKLEPWPAPVARDKWLWWFNKLWPDHVLANAPLLEATLNA